MTRRLVDVSQENIVREVTASPRAARRSRGLKVPISATARDVIESLNDRIRGRVAAEDVIDPRAPDEVIVATQTN